MAYCTQSDIQNSIGETKLIEISDFDLNGSIDTTSVTRAIDDASSLADSYLSAYLPILTVPGILRRHVTSIAIHYLRIHRDMTTEDSRRAYDEAILWLTGVANGDILMPGSGEDGADSTNNGPVLVAETRIYDRTNIGRIF